MPDQNFTIACRPDPANYRSFLLVGSTAWSNYLGGTYSRYGIYHVNSPSPKNFVLSKENTLGLV